MKLKHLPASTAAVIILACSVSTSPGQTDEFYGRADLGLNLLQDIDIGDGKLEADPGFRISLGGGWKVNEMAAIEFETGYVYNSLDDPYDSWISAVPLLANVIARYENSSRFVPYVGLGGGAALTFLGNEVDTDMDVVFAWQAQAGVAYKINDDLSLGLSYKFFSPIEQEYKIGSDTFKVDNLYNHFFGLTVMYRF